MNTPKHNKQRKIHPHPHAPTPSRCDCSQTQGSFPTLRLCVSEDLAVIAPLIMDTVLNLVALLCDNDWIFFFSTS